jgi:DNA-binding PucR family transcriptional regulator
MDALATQRLMHRSRTEVRVARHDELRAVILASADEDSAREFTARALGELAGADEALRETLRAYLQEESNATRTAVALGAHRNTVVNRLRRAQKLLPEPLAGRAVEVGLALELARWLSPPGSG